MPLNVSNAPVAIGGIGGSGTRVVAEILRVAGFYMGSDLNEANDNLWFPLLFVRRPNWDIDDIKFSSLVSIFVTAMTGACPLTETEISLVRDLTAEDRIQHSTTWLKSRAETLIVNACSGMSPNFWGWKAPNTHIFLDRLPQFISGLKYIHIARNGLDMAYSKNQNQLRIWGRLVLGGDCAVTARNSLRFWCWAQKRVLDIGADMKSNFIFVRYEDLCSEPKVTMQRILHFAGIQPDEQLLARSVALITPSKSIGRHKCFPLQDFDPLDVAYVRQLGFVVGA
ncbi:hypothetical protein MnTg02_02539 [bacterium MnTg02]|nr:hypothetical protein MnTg02_02539 [bacterium MnTg02]